MTDTRRDVAERLEAAKRLLRGARARCVDREGKDLIGEAYALLDGVLRSEGREPELDVTHRHFYAIQQWPEMATLMLSDRPEPSYPSHRGQPGRQTDRTTPVTLIAGHLPRHPVFGQSIEGTPSDSPTGEPDVEYPVDALTACIETVSEKHDASVAMGALAELRGLQRGVDMHRPIDASYHLQRQQDEARLRVQLEGLERALEEVFGSSDDTDSESLLPVEVEDHLLVRHGTWQARCLECERLGPDEAAWWKQFDCRDSPEREAG